jgi:hypothetical protein
MSLNERRINMGLIEEIRELKDEVKTIKDSNVDKPKKFKIPFTKRVGGGKAKKNYITIIKVNENGSAEFLREKIENQTVMIDKVPRIATPEYLIHHKRNPIMVIPSYSVQPISWKQNHQESLINGSNKVGYQLLLEKMKLSTVDTGKKKLGGIIPWILGLGVLGFIVYALFSGGI